MKKTLALAMALCVLMTALPLAVSAEGETRFGEGVTLTAMLRNEGNFTDIDSNAFTLYMEEKTGVHIDFTILQNEVADERMNLMLGSGNYADMIFNHISIDQMMMYGMEDKMFIPLNDYIEGSTYYKPVTEKYPTLVTDLMLPDGNIYGMSGVEEQFHGMEQAGKLHLNMTWLKNLNLEVPTTTEEFADVLRAFKEQDANLNGDPNDEIPMTGCMPDWGSYPHFMLMNAFCSYTCWGDMIFFNEEDKTLMPVWEQEHFKDGLKYVAGLYAEGLIDPAAYTQDGNALSALLAGDTQTVGAYNRGHMGTDFYENSGAEAFEMIMPLTGPYGRCGIPWNEENKQTVAQLVITDRCQQPDIAFQWADFLFSEEASNSQMYGKLGEAWDYATEGTTLTGKPAEFVALPGYRDVDPNTRWGFQRLGQHDFQTRMAMSEDKYDPDNYIYRLGLQSASLRDYALNHTINVEIDTENSEEYGQLGAALTTYYQQATIEFIVGRRDVDADWDKFLADMDNLQWNRYFEIYQDSFKNSKYAQ